MRCREFNSHVVSNLRRIVIILVVFFVCILCLYTRRKPLSCVCLTEVPSIVILNATHAKKLLWSFSGFQWTCGVLGYLDRVRVRNYFLVGGSKSHQERTASAITDRALLFCVDPFHLVCLPDFQHVSVLFPLECGPAHLIRFVVHTGVTAVGRCVVSNFFVLNGLHAQHHIVF